MLLSGSTRGFVTDFVVDAAKPALIVDSGAIVVGIAAVGCTVDATEVFSGISVAATDDESSAISASVIAGEDAGVSCCLEADASSLSVLGIGTVKAGDAFGCDFGAPEVCGGTAFCGTMRRDGEIPCTTVEEVLKLSGRAEVKLGTIACEPAMVGVTGTEDTGMLGAIAGGATATATTAGRGIVEVPCSAVELLDF
jgi:hypothetical protein